jgi:DNA-binding HxlR family transcriptional regulator
MKKRSNCPTNYALELFGDKWSLLVLRDLMFKNKWHYNEFLAAEESVSTSVLQDRLKNLEQGGIITKGEDSIKKSRIKYSLTEKGIALLPMMLEIIIWSARFDANTAADKKFVIRARREREKLLEEIKADLTEQHIGA